jgi:type I restriction enzyme S subunit
MRELPKGWKSIQLRDAGTWLSGGTPSTDEPRYWGGEIPWISAASLKNFRISGSERCITNLGVRAGTQLVSAGTVVFVVRGMSLKKEFRIGIAQRQVAFGQDCKAIVPIPEIDGTFLASAIRARTSVILGMVDEAGHGTGRLPTDLISRLEIEVPPTPEQLRIAEILNALDTQITLSESWIAKAKRLRIALLLRMMQFGIGDDGSLGDPERQPQAFKKSSIGLIPKPWRVQPIRQLLSNIEPALRSGPFGSALLKGELRDSGVPLLGIDNVEVERFVDAYSRFVDEAKFRHLKRYQVRPGDLMVTIMGTVGRCCVVPGNIGKALSSKHTWTISLDQQNYRSWLACMQINYAPWVLSHFRRDTQGGIMSAIRSETLKTTPLPVPPLSEQLEIEKRLAAWTACIEVEEDKVSKLRLLKQGLMHDLVTGRVGVPVGDTERGEQ